MNRSALITGVLVCVVFVIGFGLGRLTSGISSQDVQNLSGIDTITEALDPQGSEQTTDTVQAEGGTTINTESLTDSQRQMLQALGIDADNITITPAMVACAEAKLGVARMEEIKNGATPTFSEGAALLACYR